MGQHAGSNKQETLCSRRGEGRLQLGMLQQVYSSEMHNSPVLSAPPAPHVLPSPELSPHCGSSR